MKYFLAASVAVSVAALAFSSPSRANPNQLVNGSFEAGFAGWTVGGVSDDGYPPVVITYNNASGYPTGAFGEAIPPDNAVSPSPDPVGDHAAYFVADQAHPQTLSQNVAIIDGNTYTFGFDVYVPFNGAANPHDASFSAVVGGDNFATFLASALTPGVWTHYQANGIASGTGIVSFDFNYDSFGIPAKDFVIDRVFFGTPGVPEPASWALMLCGFGAIGAAMRQRRRAAVAFA